jgi:acyl dehydratase
MEKIFTVEPIMPIDLIKYAGASGDFNPIHTIPSVAQSLGHPDVIIHGMFMMGLITKALEEWFPSGIYESFSVRFLKPTYPGQALIIKGTFEENPFHVYKGSIAILDESKTEKLKGSVEIYHKEEN